MKPPLKTCICSDGSKTPGSISAADVLYHHLACVQGCPSVSLSSSPCQEICCLPPCPGALSSLKEGDVSLHHQWDRGHGESSQLGSWGLFRLSSSLYHHCINPLAGNWLLSALSGCVWALVRFSLYHQNIKFPSCAVFSSHLAVLSVLLQSAGLTDRHLFREWHVLFQGIFSLWRYSLYMQTTRERTP